MTKEEERNLNEDLHKFVLKDDCKDGIVGSIKCEQFNNKLLFKCLDKLCLNELSTLSYEELLKHIELYHKITSWDGMCNICGYGLWRKWNHLYMKNALEHLVSYHLIECQITNIIAPSKTDTSISKDGFPVSNMLESTISDTQTGVTVFKNLSEEISLDISEQPNQIVINNPLEASAEQAHIDQICDKKLPLLYPIDIDREEEVNCSEINPSESINGNLSTPMKMKVVCKNIPPDPIIYLEPGQQIVNNGEPIQGTYCLIDTGYKKSYLKTLKNLSFNVMKTQQAFSYMTELPRLLGLYKCFDRTCTKIFSDKMLFILHMQLHYSNMEKKKKNQIYNTEQFKKCIYCFKSFDDAESLANHIAEKYTYCKYFCSFCFYCAYEASHVFIHQSVVHDKAIPSILHLEYEEGFIENSKEILMAVDYNEFILPYRCNVGGCLFECYLHDDFLKHLNQKHQQCDKFCCYICASQDEGEGFFALQPKLMISHFKLHSINLYQCIFCLCGNDSIDSMLKHLAMEHFEYKPLCLERSPISDTCDASKIENLKIIKINKTIENCWVKKVTLSPGTSFSPEVLKKRTRKKRRLESSDVLSVAMKSASINENAQPSDAIIITVPDRAQMTEGTSITLHNDNEFIILDDVNQNDMQDPLKRVTVCSGTKNNEKDMIPHNDDVIIIDDDDDSDNDTFKKEQNKVPTKRKRSTDKSVDQSDKVKILFSCKKCDKHFTNSPDYQIHLNSCPFWRGTESMDHQCIFCSKIFPSELRLTQHIKLHGPIRFRCSVCNFKMPSRAVSTHMKNKHNLLKLDYFPEDPKFQNLDKDPFFVKERKKLAPKEHTDNQCVDSFCCGECSYKGNTQNIVVLHMKNVHNIDEYDITPVKKSVSSREYLIQRNKSINVLMPQLQSSSAKRKRKNGSNKKGSSKAKDNINSDKKKSLLFNPNTIDDIPKSHIFTEPIGCSLCTYNTKVRSNLIIHLNGHTIGQDNISKEIVNPVPSMGKSELMFDKMINLSASSFDAMNTLKMKTDEINKKIIEVDSQDDLNIDSYPQFVPKNKRYKCSAPCNYTCITEHMLMSHISILHSNFQWYICPHCPKNSTQAKVELNQIEFHLMHHSENLYRCQYCVYIDFNRDEMRAHMRKSHLPEVTSTDQSNIIVIRKTELEDIIIDRIKHQAQSIASQWICNMCSNGIKYTELEITSHIFQVHKVSHMFKCPMCQFENSDDNAKVFEKHYKLNHPSVAVKCLRVFEEVTDDEKLDKQPVIAANMLEQQALESIEPSLVPHTCRGIPIESIPTNKASNKSTPKSPKKTVKSFQSPVNKQKTLIDNFKKDDSLGYISSNGQFACPRCNEFETLNVDLFREHLYKDVNYRTWKCMNCFEISDSPKKMAWHIKKHGISSKYEKFEDNEKFKWVERVIEHQYNLFDESKKNKIQCAKGPEQSKTVVADKKTLNSPSKKRNIESVKKILIPQITDDNIINLLDDSDDE